MEDRRADAAHPCRARGSGRSHRRSRSRLYPAAQQSLRRERGGMSTAVLESSARALLDGLTFDKDGLIPAIAQQHDTGEVLMLAWMNRAAIDETLQTGRV